MRYSSKSFPTVPFQVSGPLPGREISSPDPVSELLRKPLRKSVWLPVFPQLGGLRRNIVYMEHVRRV